jgi:ATP:corrinoid adenosyltransferase
MSLSRLEPPGLVHLYTGDGKGKTSAAIGLSVRAAGHGIPVLFAQFLKSRDSGELTALAKLGIPVLRAKTSGKFVSQMTAGERQEAYVQHMELLAQVQEKMQTLPGAVVVLDEVVDAVNCGVVELNSLLELIQTRPAATELVLTGRNPATKLVALANYHTGFVCNAHPYQSGIAARPGIEY